MAHYIPMLILFNVYPRFSIYDQARVCTRNSKFFSNFALRNAFFILLSNFTYFFFGQFGLRKLITSCGFRDKVSNIWGNHQCMVNRPPSCDSVLEKVVVQSESLSCYSHRNLFTVNCYQVIASAVVGLFCICCPSTIFATIISVVIYSVQRVLWGRFQPHIFYKAFESRKPSVSFSPSETHRNSTSSIIRILGHFGIVASADHRCPLAVVGVLTRSKLVFFGELKNIFSGFIHGDACLDSSGSRTFTAFDSRAFSIV